MVEEVRVMVHGRGGGGIRAHGHGSGGRREVSLEGDGSRHRDGFLRHIRAIVVIIVEERRNRVGSRIDAAGRIGGGAVGGFTPWVVIGEVRGKVADERVKRLGPEELESVLPLFSSNQGRVGDDFEGCRFQRIIQLAETLLLAVAKETVELIGGAGLVGNLENVVVEGLWVLNRGRKRVVLIVELRD